MLQLSAYQTNFRPKSAEHIQMKLNFCQQSKFNKTLAFPLACLHLYAARLRSREVCRFWSFGLFFRAECQKVRESRRADTVEWTNVKHIHSAGEMASEPQRKREASTRLPAKSFEWKARRTVFTPVVLFVIKIKTSEDNKTIVRKVNA